MTSIEIKIRAKLMCELESLGEFVTENVYAARLVSERIREIKYHLGFSENSELHTN